MTVNFIEERIAFLILGYDAFTADDLTEDGTWAPDPSHAPNARQNAIGSALQVAARRGFIETDGRVVQSCAPHRKHGSVRVWRPTAIGLEWARQLFKVEEPE